VTVHPSIGRVCERHLGCKVVGICDDIFILAPLSEALSCAAEMKKILKADLDMDVNVPKFNVFFPDPSLSLETARSALDLAVRADPSLADLAANGAGVSTEIISSCVRRRLGEDFCCKKSTGGHYRCRQIRCCLTWAYSLSTAQFLPKCSYGLLGRNTPTPLLSEILAQVDDTIVEAVCRHGTGGGHVEWSSHLRKFANMKMQVPHFRGGFGITPNKGSAISAFYSTTCALIVWLGSHGGARPAQQFADVWAPRQDLTSPDSWHAPLLQALSNSHALLLQDYGCVEWTSASDRVPTPLAAPLVVSSVRPSVGSCNPPPMLSPVTLPQLCMLFQSTHADRQGAEASAEPGERIAKSPLQRTLTAHIMSR